MTTTTYVGEHHLVEYEGFCRFFGIVLGKILNTKYGHVHVFVGRHHIALDFFHLALIILVLVGQHLTTGKAFDGNHTHGDDLMYIICSIVLHLIQFFVDVRVLSTNIVVMPFFNSVGTFLPFCRQNRVGAFVSGASYGTIALSISSIQITNITGYFSGLNVTKIDNNNNVLSTFTIYPISNGGSFVDNRALTLNTVYVYYLQPFLVVGSNTFTGSNFLVPGSVSTTVPPSSISNDISTFNIYSSVDTTAMTMYYNFDSVVLNAPFTDYNTAITRLVDVSGMNTYYPLDLTY